MYSTHTCISSAGFGVGSWLHARGWLDGPWPESASLLSEVYAAAQLQPQAAAHEVAGGRQRPESEEATEG